MELTIIGAVQLLLGLALFVFGSLRGLFAFVMISTLFGGSAAVNLTALGGSSITPAHFALAFLLLRCVVPGSVPPGNLVDALRGNAWLVAFVLYGVLAALILPRVFAGEIDVTPLRGQIRARYGSELARILAAAPLRFSPQNVTTAVYMTGTLMMALAAHTVLRSRPAAAGAAGTAPAPTSRILVRTAATIGIVHALLGFASVALRNTPANVVFEFFRNGNYAQLDHEWNGFVRMNGVLPEASSYAAFAVVWFVFNFECWLRRVEPRRTGPAALLLGAALVASTSSSAYVGLALFGTILAVRAAVTPRLFTLDRLAWMILAGLAGMVLVSAMLVLNPVLAAALRDLLEHMTLDKAGSFSGRQRLFWAGQGLEAFVVSHGLGIGPGSFRSSSLAAAILGSVGVIGAAAFAGHFLRAFKPLALSTWMRSGEAERDTAAAAAWAMLVGVGVASVSAPSCDPGLTFAILSGSAIALRSGRRTAEAVPEDAGDAAFGAAPAPAFGPLRVPVPA
ncbi:hypothetical protein [Novosphingobium sp. P6W]|uniref:hypothetical protein n=1 Tax=Novosphingobium sp. P6W TaxID=1609758 RepID=UPI0005C6B54A|nr:hypothetical protein [Novosphingobium sp. P6W]AXB77593.1 hypothetical protein TQ38_014670 [Novosphingobium sp. P6W]